MFGLMVAVMTSPIRPATPAHAGCRYHNFGPPSGKAGRHSVAAAARAGYRVKAVRSETEECDRSATIKPAFCGPEPALHTAPARELSPTIANRPPQPLRC
jgi:hypothetical protein